MKHFPSLLVSVSLITFSACKKTSTSPEGGGSGNPAVTATVNGKTWTALLPFNGSSALNGTYFGGGNDTSEIDIYYPKVEDTGTYIFDDTSFAATYSPNQDFFISVAHSGSVHFSVFTQNQVVGTFNFIAKDSAGKFDTITNGRFNMGL